MVYLVQSSNHKCDIRNRNKIVDSLLDNVNYGAVTLNVDSLDYIPRQSKGGTLL